MSKNRGNEPITELIRWSRMLTPQDSLHRAAGLLRASGMPALPVVLGGRVLGLLSEAEALSKLVPDGQHPPADVGLAMKQEPVCANKYMSRGQAAEMLVSSGQSVLPVIDEHGTYQGLLARSDVLGSICDALRPPSPAGMATPLGVHLTTGALKAGPGNLGLFLTGLMLYGLIYSASLISHGLALLTERLTGLPILAMLASPPIARPNMMDLALYLTMASSVILMMLLLRLSPLSGYHAAEHMVVHAIESGEPLESEIVRQMPRVHPRCGTNLLAAAAILLLLSTVLSAETTILVGLVIIIVGWRTIGGILQYFVTTRVPSEKQLENAIGAGRQLIERYREAPNRVATDKERIWNMGLLQTAAGLATGFGIDALIRVVTGFSPLVR